MIFVLLLLHIGQATYYTMKCQGRSRVSLGSGAYTLGVDYRGTHSRTESGKECQKWRSQSPHAHTKTYKKYPDAGLDEDWWVYSAEQNNYCRNPGNEAEGVWCFTTDSETRWERCDVPDCNAGEAMLYDAEQSSKYCTGFLKHECYPAKHGLSDDSHSSITGSGTGTHWWQASMATVIVQQVEVKANAYPLEGNMTVSLYNGGALAGTCQPFQDHTGEAYTLDCDRVAADRVRVAATSTDQEIQLWVYSIRVIIAHCSKPQAGLLNGKLAPSSDSIPSDSSYILTCNPGSKLTGPAKMKCSNGSLSSISTCMPVGSFALASLTSSDPLHSADQAIDNDLSTYSVTNPTPGAGSKPWVKVYFPASVELGEITFKTYCFSERHMIKVCAVVEGVRSTGCVLHPCGSYGEVTTTSSYDHGSMHALLVEYNTMNTKDPLILFDIKWSG